MARKLLVLPTAHAVRNTYEQLAQMEQANFSMDMLVAGIINGPLQYDIQGCISYDSLTEIDELVFSSQEDRQIYASAYYELLQSLSLLLVDNGLYDHNRQFSFHQMLGSDLMLALADG